MTSVAEKPLCKCHGEPMGWAKNTCSKHGGYWRCAVKHREANRRWYEANPDKKQEVYRRWYEANPDKKREYNRRYREANPDNVAASNARRMRVCGIYVGMCGWTETEIKEMTSGATH